MTSIGRNESTGHPDPTFLALPDLTASPLVLRDVEAFFLGLLEDEHVLGGPVRSGRTGPMAVLDGADVQGGGILIRDEEHTPIAALTDLRPHRGSAVRDGSLSVRRRESGSRAELALDQAELSVESPSTSTALLVLDRPPTTADEPALQDVLSGSAHTLWVVVADTPATPSPDDGGGDGGGVVGRHRRLAVSLEGREPHPPGRDDGQAADRTRRMARPRERPCHRHPAGCIAGSRDHLLAGSDDASAGSRMWQSLLATLRTGTAQSLAGVDIDVARILLRWRPLWPAAE